MQHVGAALRHHVHVAAQGATEFGLRAGRDHLELFDGIDGVCDTAQRSGIIVRRQTVDDEVVGQVSLTAHREADTWHSGGLREQLRAGDVRGRHARDEQCQFEEVPSVHRKTSHFRLGHRTCDLAASRFEHRRVACHRNIRVDGSQAERDWQLECGADGQCQMTNRVLEAVLTNRDFVRADPQVRKAKSALLVGVCGAGQIGLRMPNRDLRPGHDGARRIRHATADAGQIDRLLSENRQRPSAHGAQEQDASYQLHRSLPRKATAGATARGRRDDATKTYGCLHDSTGEGQARGGGRSGGSKRLTTFW